MVCAKLQKRLAASLSRRCMIIDRKLRRLEKASFIIRDCTRKNSKPMKLNCKSMSVSVNESEPSKFEVSVIRTETDDGASSYTVKIDTPVGATVTVDPPELVFNQKEEKRSYVVNITTQKANVPPASENAS